MHIEMVCLKVFNIVADLAIVSLDWYNGKHGHFYALCPTLVICYENGFMQLMCNESDSGKLYCLILISCLNNVFTDPVVVETRMTATYCGWNHNGSLLAVAGKQHSRDDNRSSNVVQFYNPFGEVQLLVRFTLKFNI